MEASTATAPPQSAYELQEALASRPSPLDADGNIRVHIIRPTIGEGLGSHLYTPEMLQENAHKFTGWKMYIDHQSPQAKKAAGGLPRSIRDIGGRIVEAKWDPTVPAEGRFGQGAVVGTVKPVGQVKKIIEDDPEVLEASIRAKATDVHPETINGKQVWVVEGIRNDPPGSVDWVSEGGAGGRVVDLLEALVHEEDVQPEVDPSEDDTDIEEAKLSSKERDALPDSAFAIPEDRAYPIHDESHAKNALTRVAQNGSPDEQKRVRAAVKKRHPKIEMQETPEQEDDELSATSLLEALRDPEGEVAQAVNEIVETRVSEKLAEQATEHERELEEARESARQDARDETQRQIDLRDMRDEAHRIIEEAKLPGRVEQKLLSEYQLDGGEPTAKLDRVDEVDADGQVTTSAQDALTESVHSDIKEQRDMIAEINPTQVRGQGPNGDTEPAAKPTEKSFWREQLEESRIDPDVAYPHLAAKKPEDDNADKKESD